MGLVNRRNKMGKASRNKGSYRPRMYVIDFDDYCDATVGELRRLKELKEMYPDFKCTLFTIPMKTSKETVDAAKALNTPEDEWIKLAPHGWHHTRGECLGWTDDEAYEKIWAAREMGIDSPVFRAPGWLLDGHTYMACRKLGYVVAAHQIYRIPFTGAKEYVYNDVRFRRRKVRSIHGHVTPVSGNYIEAMMQDGRMIMQKKREVIHLEDAAIVEERKGVRAW